MMIKLKLFIPVLLINLTVLAHDHVRTGEVINRNGFVLKIQNTDPNLDIQLKEKMVEIFFDIYPRLIEQYNPFTSHGVIFFIDTAYSGVAEAGCGVVRFSADWLKSHPSDVDVIAHELMHLVQDYLPGASPWWITEGIADYVRYKYGVNNEAAGWALTDFDTSQNYDNGYRITARFFVWIEKRVLPGFIEQLDEIIRLQSYSEYTWSQLTGRSVEELWAEYSTDPTI